jgi:hypothetical protein
MISQCGTQHSQVYSQQKIYRVEQFFDYQQTNEEEKISLAAYHLEGAAQMWYQLFKESEELMSWETLKSGLYTRYGSNKFEDHFGDLTKATTNRFSEGLSDRV